MNVHPITPLAGAPHPGADAIPWERWCMRSPDRRTLDARLAEYVGVRNAWIAADRKAKVEGNIGDAAEVGEGLRRRWHADREPPRAHRCPMPDEIRAFVAKLRGGQ